MNHHTRTNALDRIGELLAGHGFDGMTQALTVLLDEVMKPERAHALGAAPCERTEGRQGHANGYKPKAVLTRMGPITLAVPQARRIDSCPSAPEEGVRGERALKPAVAEMYVQGVSTREVAAITEQPCGSEIGGARVSRAAAALDAELQARRQRPPGEMPYWILDARCEKVRHGGPVVSCAVPVAIGIDAQGPRSILGTGVSLSGAEPHRRDFLAGLQGRGLHGVRMIAGDAHAGLEEAPRARSPAVPW